jgi:hypothetical protein
MSSSTGELADLSLLQTVRTDELFLAVQQVPAVAAAFQAVIDSVAPLQDWIAARNTPIISEPDPIVEEPAPE